MLSHRRWLRFSLRTLFVVLTLVSCAVWYALGQSQWLRQRRAFLDGSEHGLSYGISNTRAPGMLWAFGESGITVIIVDKTDKPLAQKLFPEARVVSTDETPPRFSAGNWYIVHGSALLDEPAGKVPGH